MKQQRIEGCKVNQNELAKHGTIGNFVAPPPWVIRRQRGQRASPRSSAAALVRGHDANQTELFSSTADRAGTVTEPALLACGRAALHSSSRAERLAAAQVLGASMRGNSDGQLLLVSTLAPTGLGSEDGSDESSLRRPSTERYMPKSGSQVAFDDASRRGEHIARDAASKR